MFTKKIFTAYVFVLALMVAVMLTLAYHKPVVLKVRDYPEICREGVLRIVTEYDRAGYFLQDGDARGFQYALSREIARLSGIETLLYLEMNLEKSFYGLSTNQYDVVARNIPVTSQLKESWQFTEPVALNRQVLVQRRTPEGDARTLIRNQVDLAHCEIHIPKGSPVLLRLQNLQQEIGDTIFVVEDPLYSSEQLCIMVAKGDIDFTVCDQQSALLAQREMPELDVDTGVGFTQLQSWAVRPESTILADSLNRWIQRLRDSGTFDAIYRRYYRVGQ
jgi:membrane-bound lytic murein transglycosylase MltF